jgi:hypothetical protein
MKSPATMLTVLAIALPLTIAPAFAQTGTPRAAISLTVGAVTGASDSGAAVGGALLFDLSDHVSLEGQGTYLDRGRGASAFSVEGDVLVNMVRATGSVVPYAVAGGGVYRVSFDLDHPRFLGPVGAQFAGGTTVCPAPGPGFGSGPGPGFGRAGDRPCSPDVSGYWGVGELPLFYARRLGPLTFPRGAAWDGRSFTDPAASLGGGVRVHVTERFVIRPDLRALVVFADGDTHTLGVFTVKLGYRF